MSDKKYEQSIRKQLRDTFNDGFAAFEEFKNNRPMFETCIRQHMDKAKMLLQMNTDMELLCLSLDIDFKAVIEEEYQKALRNIHILTT